MRARHAVLIGWIAGCTPTTPKDPADPSDPSDPSDPLDPSETTEPTTDEPPDEPPATILDDTFRIDLSEIDVTFDLVPDEALDGHAELVFTMRPGQVRALFHFDPLRTDARDALRAITLDGEALDPSDDADLRLIQFDSSPEVGFELQRDLEKGVPHTLIVDWSIPGGFVGAYPGWFHSLVDDTAGRGNEELWPTINAPDELARHRIEVRIDDPREYRMIGSGTITSAADGRVQVWSLDTEREISSYTVMVAAMPVEDVRIETFDVGAVPVTIVSTEGPADTDAAVERTRGVMQDLEADFGPFPMPSMQILLIDWPTGMEYYGATSTGLSSLTHEVIHMYWGCSAVNRTWRDTWMDEAINTWWEHRDQVPAPPEGLATDIVSGRTEIEPGFDLRAYGVGAVIFGAVAQSLGGDDELITFLADLHQRRAFAPYTTDDLIDDLVLETGDEALRADFERWVDSP